MQLELAERGGRRNRVFVQGYKRHANYVPSYSRHKPHLNDSSLFSFKLAGKPITNANAYLVVPDPDNKKAPRLVRVDMFQNLRDAEFLKLLDYVQDFNTPEQIDEATQAYLNPGLSDPIVAGASQAESALSTVESVFQGEPNGTTVVADSFWNKKWLFGIENKFTLPLVGFGLYKLLF